MEDDSKKNPLKQQLVAEVKTTDMDNVFQAEEILNERKKRNKIEYFVKWKGYSSKLNTWEPKKNILDPVLIQEFQEKIKAKKKSKYNHSTSNDGPKVISGQAEFIEKVEVIVF